MSRYPRTKSHAILALMALIAGVGCSSLPTGPSSEVGSATGAGAAATAAAIREPVPIESLTSTKRIYGTFGGRVSVGNFTVVIPPLAVSGTPTVKVTQPDPSKPYVHLEIYPSSANKFRVPVTLVVNAGPMSAEKLSVAYISWYNPSTRTWEKMLSSEVNLVNRTVTCPLWHFSEYAVQVDGKAGW